MQQITGGAMRKKHFFVLLGLILILVFSIFLNVTITNSESVTGNNNYKSSGKINLCETAECLFVYNVINYENKRLTEIEKQKIAKAITFASLDERFRHYGISYIDALCLLMGIAKIESNFNPYAVSPKKAVGIKQIHLPTWKISYKEAFDINFNVLLGKEILLYYLTKSNGNLVSALHRYYGAPSYAYSSMVLNRASFYKKIYMKVFNALKMQ